MEPANWIFVLVAEQGAYGDTVNLVLRGIVYMYTHHKYQT